MPPRYRQRSTDDASSRQHKRKPSTQRDQDHDVDEEGRIEDGLTHAVGETEDALRKRRLRERQEIGRPRDPSRR